MSKDTIGAQVMIKARSLTPLHQRMDWMMRARVRPKDMANCDETPINMEEESMKLQSRGKYILGSRYS